MPSPRYCRENLVYSTERKHVAVKFCDGYHLCLCGYHSDRSGLLALDDILRHIRTENELIVHVSWGNG